LLGLYLYAFHYAALFGQPEPDTGLELCTSTDVVKKELDVLFDAGHGACTSLQIAGSSKLTAMELAEKLKLVPLVEDWKKSAARGGARTALTLGKAYYPELILDLVTSGVPETYDDRAPMDETAIWQSMLGYDQLCAIGTQLDVYYEAYALPDSPSNASAAVSKAAEAGDGGDGVTSAATQT
jgi:hypothetical protein